ncbi:stalk domain-containing protein [Paenibacillus sp. FSL R10-2771]|uniref:stalk domain-containing protein n=1 Tax=Paenibacillus sp. FSL R10-2771 TaxID=2954693 RepID=UPI0030FCD200
MKNKVFIVSILLSLLFTGIVNAASIWGSYKGNDIIKIMYNGKTLSTNDVPAVSLNGRTMIPISMLSQVGIQYTWNQTTKTVTITSTNGSTASNNQTSNVQKTYPSLYSNDLKVYLGKLTTDKYDKDSIYNEYGTYGSKYQTKSIWNEYGTYGSKFSSESAFNELASTPPAIVYNGEIFGHLTTNSTISDGVNIAGLLVWLNENGF